MTPHDHPIKPPSRRLLLLEPRGLADIPALFAAAPFLLTTKRGRKHGVVVLPGFGADDNSTVPLRRYLTLLGYDVHGWKRGRNVRRPGEDLPAVIAQIKALQAKHKLPVTLIGWSRGGIMAREIARQIPDHVRMVITLGSPFADATANNVGAIWKLLTGEEVPRNPDRMRQLAEPIPVPATAIYTKSDGVVAWRLVLRKKGLSAKTSKCARRISGLGFMRRRCGRSRIGWGCLKARGRNSSRAGLSRRFFRASVSRVICGRRVFRRRRV